MQMSFRSTVRTMIGNTEKLFPPKTCMRKIQVLQDAGYVKGVKSASCMLHAILQGRTKYPMLKESKEIENSHNIVNLRHLSLLSKESKVHSIYNVDSNMKSLNYIKIRFKGLIYFELEQTSN